jgi:flagellar basal-body rod protein FlgB
MAGDIFTDNTLGLLEKTLTWRSQGQAIIAGNLANLDTPNFNRKEVDFKGVLKNRLEGRPGIKLATSNPHHIQGSPVESGLAKETRQAPDVNQEMVDLSLTQLGYQTSVTMLNKKLGQLKTIVGP